MPEHPLFFAGAAIAAIGWLTFLGVLFASGGVAKSQQFAAIARLFRGEHGPLRRWLTIGGLLFTAAGACMLFAGVGASDAERARRCRDECAREGYERGVIGPSEERDDRGRASFLACTCQGEGREPLELRADSL